MLTAPGISSFKSQNRKSAKGDKEYEGLVSIPEWRALALKHYFTKKTIRIGEGKLIAAQQNPEEYKDPIVRVAGYSDHFRNFSKALQDEIIERTEQSFA